MKKAILLTTFFLTTPLLIIFSIAYLSFLSYSKNNPTLSFFTTKSNPVAYSALPETKNVLNTTVVRNDARVEIVKAFLNRYGSDLEPFAQNIVDSADKYQLDYRLIPSIAMQESNLCKKAPKDSYNCWGFGIYGKKVTRFSNYQDAIDTVTKTLAKQYKSNGLVTPSEIMTRYTPSSNGSWAYGVNQFMNQLQL
jgi:hypothetical protein